jgi:hydroxymethylglutaryl-CoA lyase
MKIVECPRDAMQGIADFIPTATKAAYINQLLKVGFDTIDFGSFVSPKAIPQLRDTAEVLANLNLSTTSSKLLAIVANSRGAENACLFPEITYLGFPFSISDTFQQRNTNSSIIESLKRVEEIQSLCVKNRKQLVIYISMAFGNPYGDDWSADVVVNWTKKISQLGVKTIALADTTGVSNSENINYLFSNIIPEFNNVEIGAHLHTTPNTWKEKIDAAYNSGCRRFDVAVKGFGGCPMASDKLTGNMPTENLMHWLTEKNINSFLNIQEFNVAYKMSADVFPNH